MIKKLLKLGRKLLGQDTPSPTPSPAPEASPLPAEDGAWRPSGSGAKSAPSASESDSERPSRERRPRDPREREREGDAPRRSSENREHRRPRSSESSERPRREAGVGHDSASEYRPGPTGGETPPDRISAGSDLRDGERPRPRREGQERPSEHRGERGGRDGGRGRDGRDGRDGGRGRGRSGSRSDGPPRDRVLTNEEIDNLPPEPETVPSNTEPLPLKVPLSDSFAALGLGANLLKALAEEGYSDPTPIQAEAIPIALTGRELIGSAQTGTGKTAAFALPLLQKMSEPAASATEEPAKSSAPAPVRRPIRALILEPTRELALQVTEAFTAYGRHTGLRVATIYGGVALNPQITALHRGVDIVVATPGRLLDLMERQAADLRGVQFLVLDEVDRMLDMGFLPDVRRIIESCPRQRQTLFFSATIPPVLAGLVGWALNDPQTVTIGNRTSPAETIRHVLCPVSVTQKGDLLKHIIRTRVGQEHNGIVFCRTRMGADRVAAEIEQEGIGRVATIHSDRSQKERVEALEGFKSGKYNLLVATDIAARGLDIDGVEYVINFNIPENPEDYVHRIGRTGRAQATGEAFTLICGEDLPHVKAVEVYVNQELEREKVEGFDYAYTVLFEKTPPAPRRKPAGRKRR